MYIIYEIQPKSEEEYQNVIEFIGEYLNFYHIQHRKFESKDKIEKINLTSKE